jgi:hypothetical protein
VHPLLNNLRGLLAYLLACVLASLALASAWLPAASIEGGWGWAWGRALLGFVLPVAVLTGATALAMYPVCRSLPLRPARWAGLVAQRAAAALLLALLVSGAAALWNLIGGAALSDRGGLVPLAGVDWLGFYALQALAYVLSALVHDALLAHEAARSAVAAELQARLHAREMEIKALRNQIDPHFLFNSLNSISALTQSDPVAARAMTIDLAEFFRLTLRLGGRERIQLADELDLVRSYLGVELRRLGDKLRLDILADDNCHAAWLPPLVLQPLVENAVKHGIRLLDEGGTIEVGARHVGNRLELQVANPVDDQAQRDTSGLGQGLHHLRMRLQALYGEAASVSVDTAAGNRYTVTVSLPWQTT